jgi:hypothetical protein
MGTPDLGPDWFWKLVGVTAIAGFASLVYLVVKAILWIINHISIT